MRKITHREFQELKIGDTVFLKCGNDVYQSEIIRKPFYNSDSDEPDWEVETTNGFSDEHSLYVEE